MENNPNNNRDIICPLIDDWTSFVDCMENRDTKADYIPDKFKNKPNWKDICKNCQYSKY